MRQTTNIEVKKNNRNRIFRYICEHGTVSNPDISYDIKMSLPTVTQNTKELIERGLVTEVGELKSTGGRRAKALSVSSNARQAAGLDITKNHISLVLTNLMGEMLKYEHIFLPFEESEDYFRTVSERLESFLEEGQVDRDRLLGLGISFPGIVDLNKEMIAYSHILGVDSVPFSDVSRYFSVQPCCFLNDANAGAYAEGIRAGKPERFFYFSLSNSVGGAIFSNHELIQGAAFRCGEIGHMTIIPDGDLCYCGKRGCLDAYCSASRLARTAQGKLEQFFEEVKQGSREHVDIWDQYTNYLAIAINNIHMVLDCDVVLGGYVGSCAEPYIEDIWKKVSGRNTFVSEQVYLRSCKYKTGAAALGAALHVIEQFIEEV